MVSVMKSLNAFDELINEVSTHRITFAAKACVDRLKDATEDLRTFFNENPGDRLAIQHKYNIANTYALQVEYFLCMYDGECNRRYKERENAKALYNLARQLLYGYVGDNNSKESRDYFLLVDYVSIAQKYYIACENFIIDMTDDFKMRVEEMSKYLANIARDMNGISVEEYNARSDAIHENEESSSGNTDNNEKSAISEEVMNDAEMVEREQVVEETVIEEKPEPVRSVPNDFDL